MKARALAKFNAKIAKVLGLCLTIGFVSLASGENGLVWVEFPDTVSSNSVTLWLKPEGEPPEFMAVIVLTNIAALEQQKAMERWQNEIKTNRNAKFIMPPTLSSAGYSKKAKWIPFKTNLIVNLGPGDGQREIMRGFRYKGQTVSSRWSGSSITVQTLKTSIEITGPAPGITFQQILELKGFSTKPLNKIEYDLFDQSGEMIVKNGSGFVTGQYFDKSLFDYTTNYFQCFDVNLSPGTNTLHLSCTDMAGNCTTTNLIYVFTTVGDTNPPVFVSVDWPKPGMKISGSSFTARGRVDDYTAKMTGQVVADGRTNTISGYSERNGYYWYDVVPLALGSNYLTLTATDAAGNTSSTNLAVCGVNGLIITLDPIVPPEKLWQFRITVTGMVIPAGNQVWVNGVQAVVKSDGTWRAENVPVFSPGGAATFEMTTVPPEGMTNGTVKLNEIVSSQANLSTNAITLNPSVPVCGVFQLHINNTAGRSFILSASTNLTEWTPILTNVNANATFDYTDKNADNYRCRYFKVVPLQ